ncbi:interleukin-27 subunit beta isoform X1 [Epinephelus fuscoguttatus]|uniref:interleukin-27 subunit beta isoform X1 n=1 Tax=Epinephelus fuscoguttatus TaxID=293821 RepID=UPI0020D05C40|nr:interleukin-27 subunit beta isoform X1 [Epinephelus fuscoguttatus]
MAAMVGSVGVMVTLLMCVLGGQALDLLRVTATSGTPPSTPRVHCWCSSYPNMTLCSWPEPSISPPTHYIATYSERHRPLDTKQCQLIQPGSSSSDLTSTSSSSSERLWHCQLPNLRLLTDYIFNITAVYSGGSSSHLSSFMLEDIVKPDPPVNVRVSPQDVRNLLVQWSPPPSWANLNIFPLKYQILYRWENRGNPKSVNEEEQAAAPETDPQSAVAATQIQPTQTPEPRDLTATTPSQISKLSVAAVTQLGPFESTKVELKGLTPGRTYVFQVCAKELLGLGMCSDWSSPVKITIPRRKL